jgi:hypothetical protein
MRPEIKLGLRGFIIAIAAGVAFAFVIGSLDYVWGTAKDRTGILGWLFPTHSAYPDMPLEDIGARLAELMADQSYRREPGPPRRLEIEGCLVTVTTRDHGRQICEMENASYWKTQEFFDLRLLVTDPRKVTVSSITHPRAVGAAAIEIPMRDEAARRLRPLYRLFSDEVTREMRRDTIHGTYDLPARMERLRAFVRDELTDRLFTRHGERTFYCEAGVLLAPSRHWRAVRLFTSEAHAREVVELLHAHAVRACPFDPAALE